MPVVLTVEEAGELLRIGRTKAYALAREWRATGGQSGLPVIDLGHVLRVPRRALEERFGIDVTGRDSVDGSSDGGRDASPAGEPSSTAPPASRTNRSRNPNLNQHEDANQLNLLTNPETPTS
jgi:hypothetical protein